MEIKTNLNTSLGVLIGSDQTICHIGHTIAAHSLHIIELVDLFLSPKICDVRIVKKYDILQQ